MMDKNQILIGFRYESKVYGPRVYVIPQRVDTTPVVTAYGPRTGTVHAKAYDLDARREHQQGQVLDYALDTFLDYYELRL